jgi:hypothetical protein
MQEHTDPSLDPSKGGDDTQRNDPVSAHGESDLGNKTVSQNNEADTAGSKIEAENSSLDEAELESAPAASSNPAALVEQPKQSVDFSRFAPMADLMRKPSNREIILSTITSTQGGGIHLDPNQKIRNRIPLGLYRSLVLPTEIKQFGTTRELFFSIQALLKKHVPLPTRDRSLLTYWAMATWFPEFLPFLPSLAITGTPSAADFLLQTLVAVCRRPILLAEVSPAALSALPLGDLMPTLLIRELQISKRMAALLDASTQPGYLVSSGNNFQQFYCPKCIYVGEHPKDQLRSANNIQIHVGGNSVRPLYRPPTEEVINDFQNRLITYRLLNRDKVAASKYRVSAFRPEICAIAEALGAAIADDPELQGGITKLLEERDEQARVDRANGQNGVVLRAVLIYCHEHTQEQVFVREIAATANEIYHEDGESLRISNETVGHVLKSLGLYSRRLGGAGRGLILDKATQSRVHRLGQAYEVLPAVPTCGFCQSIQIAQPQAVVMDV